MAAYGPGLESWSQERTGPGATVAFPNARGYRMARDGVEYLLRQAAKKAAATCSTLQKKRVSPTCCATIYPSGLCRVQHEPLGFGSEFQITSAEGLGYYPT